MLEHQKYVRLLALESVELSSVHLTEVIKVMQVACRLDWVHFLLLLCLVL